MTLPSSVRPPGLCLGAGGVAAPSGEGGGRVGGAACTKLPSRSCCRRQASSCRRWRQGDRARLLMGFGVGITSSNLWSVDKFFVPSTSNNPKVSKYKWATRSWIILPCPHLIKGLFGLGVMRPQVELSIGARTGSVFLSKCYGSKQRSHHTATYLTRPPPPPPVAFGQSFHLSLLFAAVAATMKYELALTLFDECALLLRKRPP